MTKLWKIVKGKLLHVKDETRIKFKNSISQTTLDHLQELAAEHHTYPNYLLETGLRRLLEKDVIIYNKKLRPKDRVQYQTTFDKELLKQVKEFAKKNKLYINDVMEYSVQYIDPAQAKDQYYRSRIERG
jgi:hypothetical protein